MTALAPTGRWREVLLVAGLLLLTTAVACQSPGPVLSQPPAAENGSPADTVAEPLDPMFNLSAEEFRALRRAQQPIDVDEIDYLVLSAAIFHETNRRRFQNGRSPLLSLVRLNRVARMHAEDMVMGRFFDHINPHDANKRTVLDRLLLFNLLPIHAAENIAHTFILQYESGQRYYRYYVDGVLHFGYGPTGPAIPAHSYVSFAEHLVEDWMQSQGHRSNILSDAPAHLGTGCAHYRRDPTSLDQLYCAQVFLK